MKQPETIAFLPTAFLSEIQRKEIAEVAEPTDAKRAQFGADGRKNGAEARDEEVSLVPNALEILGAHDPKAETEEQFIERLNDMVATIAEDNKMRANANVEVNISEPVKMGDAATDTPHVMIVDNNEAETRDARSTSENANAEGGGGDDEVIIIDEVTPTPETAESSEAGAPKQLFTSEQLKDTEMQLCEHGQVSWTAVIKGHTKAVSRTAAERLLEYYGVRLRDTQNADTNGARTRNVSGESMEVVEEQSDRVLTNGVNKKTASERTIENLKTGQVDLCNLQKARARAYAFDFFKQLEIYFQREYLHSLHSKATF